MMAGSVRVDGRSACVWRCPTRCEERSSLPVYSVVSKPVSLCPAVLYRIQQCVFTAVRRWRVHHLRGDSIPVASSEHQHQRCREPCQNHVCGTTSNTSPAPKHNHQCEITTYNHTSHYTNSHHTLGGSLLLLVTHTLYIIHNSTNTHRTIILYTTQQHPFIIIKTIH